jgi:hypothetical protein
LSEKFAKLGAATGSTRSTGTLDRRIAAINQQKGKRTSIVNAKRNMQQSVVSTNSSRGSGRGGGRRGIVYNILQF